MTTLSLILITAQIEEIQRELMKKTEVRPYDRNNTKDGNFNFIHQEYVADAFVKIRELVKKDTSENTVPRGVVESAMHIIDGLVHRPNNISRILEVWNQGCMELYQSLIPFAEECHRLYREGCAANEEGVPGVFDYEVSCEFGGWYGNFIMIHGGAPDLRLAKEKLFQLNSEFWDQRNTFRSETSRLTSATKRT